VLDIGCGTGENIIPLVDRGARVTGIDISPELIRIAQERIGTANAEASLIVGSAYETGLPNESVDAILCVALIHHLDIETVRDEMWRILRGGGVIVLKEPIRFSKAYAWLRSLLPERGEISEFEHPLTREELSTMTQRFKVEGTRYFLLPFVLQASRVLRSKSGVAQRISDWIIQHWASSERYATVVVTKLQKPA